MTLCRARDRGWIITLAMCGSAPIEFRDEIRAGG